MTFQPPVDEMERHQVYWLEDGNIILVLEDRIAFRVYRGHLARHSLVFADMVALSSPTTKNDRKAQATVEPPEFRPASSPQATFKQPKTIEEQEYYDGSPVLRMSQDRAEDFAALLDVVLQVTPADPSFNMLEGVLRISTKYLFEGVRAWAVEHMQARLPTTLHDLLADPTLEVYGDRTLAARVISLAREFDLPQLIPLALYAIVSFNFAEPPAPASPLFSPQSSPTATTFPPAPPPPNPYIAALATIHATLPSGDVSRFTLGRQRLSEAAVSYLFQLREYGLMKISCSRKVGQYHRTCAAGNVHAVWSRPQPAVAEFLRNPLGIMAVEGKAYDFSTMCGDCNTAGQAKHIELVEDLFGRLSEIFMLDDHSFERR
ncbi:hypothetical protein FS837_012304 [Tulasnella sp. UAMH 9824]|nr:hypothetical protein FS837_012304 [Tulasnella sp. UAMH 9824]